MSYNPPHILPVLRKAGICCLLLCLFFVEELQAQEVQVKGSADTTQIRIGEQITYTITVETDTTAQVIFPEGQTFSPLETVEAFKTDTTRKVDRMTLQKRYALTQFDSGTYLLPKQRVDINGIGFMTDSALVRVGDVAVDTTKQKLYDIKSNLKVDRSFSEFWFWFILITLFLLLAAGLYYYLKKGPLGNAAKEAKLPPYDRALLELKRLETSQYLIHEDYKGYYSDLTGILRAYLEEEAHIAALESTSGQLLERIEMLKDAGELELDKQTLAQFRRVLETADLVKFARSKPANRVAESDREIVEQIVRKTHDALPEPSEEELLEEEARIAAEEARKRKQKIRFAGIGAILLLLLSTAAIISYYGWSDLKDEVFGTPTKDLLESEWIRSDYGFPPVSLESPEVLLRQMDATWPAEVTQAQKFEYNHPELPLQIGTASLTLQRENEEDLANGVEEILLQWESEGARNLITKEEAFTTPSGVKGVKIFGTGTFPTSEGEDLRAKYVILIFAGDSFEQRVYMTWPEQDSYAEEIANRVLETVDVKSAV